jgi:hypothetical protein
MALKEIKYTAVLIESERGWGQTIQDQEEFDSEEDRDSFITKYNSKNTEDDAPDWYMYARPAARRSEHLVYTEGVGGSNPSGPTKFNI